ncbi:HSP-70 cofactor [Candidatus Rubidus massiliensis]|mgnify:CR=1 FL=1|nr:MAG: nucleotide exchange factor GrpE [Chlamydia sp. 32-24]CDZ80827.1 HSP-70 cofactor [Candidatus Rubidus massiliensis]
MTNHENSDETINESNPEESVEESVKETQPQPKLIEISQEELDKLKKEVNDYKDKYLRLLAESENARKRLYKEKQELTQYAIQNIIVEFLHPIDHLENALKYTTNMSQEVKNWAIGFQMILGQFKDVLSTNGIYPFETIGKEFDPHTQEAIEMVETNEYPQGYVVEQNVQGYKMGDRVIRPARVKVAKAIKENEANQEEIKQ